MKEGSENGASLLKLIWALFFRIQIMSGAESGGSLELL
jgi:hypothetical protein